MRILRSSKDVRPYFTAPRTSCAESLISLVPPGAVPCRTRTGTGAYTRFMELLTVGAPHLNRTEEILDSLIANSG